MQPIAKMQITCFNDKNYLVQVLVTSLWILATAINL